ncbi:MAG: glyoxalase/bleomycin resistance/dioxygenase family protein [Clostridia bacterium]|nr:glyoxalase/bleomycin resistance/dioxygenase family protein [Clostridia bacterium]
MKFEGVLFAVKSMAVSRAFYEQILERKVAMDLGANLVFEGGPTLQEGFGALVGFPEENTQYRAYNTELYFETDALDEDVARLKAAGVELLHDIKEYPWGQRVFRFFDPDGHIIELGENMGFVVVRFLRSGMSAEDVAARTGFPEEVVTQIESSLIP